MKVVLPVLALLLGSATALCSAQVAPTGTNESALRGVVPSRSAQAAEAGDDQRSVGEMPAESRALPQIALPLRRDGDAAAGPQVLVRQATGGSVDDSAARCGAKKTAAERSACQAPASRLAPATPVPTAVAVDRVNGPRYGTAATRTMSPSLGEVSASAR